MAASKQNSEIVMQQIGFDPADPKAALAQLPQTPAVFALYGAEAHAEPYIGRTPNLRARLERLLQPSARHPRRLQLAGRVRRIVWHPTGSEFESLLLQFEMLQKVYSAKALERMHLRSPAFVRFLGSNPYPRITVTHRPSQREADWSYGPFASRAAAERYAEEMLKLFLLRRCTFELEPDPTYPGCVYSEMKMCLAPCYKGCTDERYGEEAAAVEGFLATRGESKLVVLRSQREAASANLEFESAAALHAQVQRVEGVRALAAELVRPLSRLRAVILQASANPGEVAVFLYENGRLSGPAQFSTLGIRIQNEQSGSTSLFPQPMAIEAIPEDVGNRDQGSEIRKNSADDALECTELSPHIETIQSSGPEGHIDSVGSARGLKPPPPSEQSVSAGCIAPEGIQTASTKLARGVLEARMEAALAELADSNQVSSTTVRQGHLALLKRWYYRPEARRSGEIFFPDAEDNWPVKSILRGVGRVAAKALTGASRD